MKNENNIKTKNRLNLISVFLVIVLAVSLLTYYSYSYPVVEFTPVIKNGPLDPPAVVIENGSMAIGPTYYIGLTGSDCWMRDGETGEILFISTDHDAVINSAIGNCSAGDYVLLGPYTFSVNAEINIGSSLDYFVFSGCGRATKLDQIGSITGFIIDVDGGSGFSITDVCIKDMVIDGNGYGSTDGIGMQYITRSKIENVRVHNMGDDGVYWNHANDNQMLDSYLDNNGDEGFYLNSAHEFILRNTHAISNGGHGFYFDDDGTIDSMTMQVQILGCSAENNGGEGIYMIDDGAGWMNDSRIIGFTMDFDDIHLHACHKITIEGVEGWSGNIEVFDSDEIVIKGCTIISSSHAIWMRNCSMSIIDSNILHTSANGIKLEDCYRIISTSNQIWDEDGGSGGKAMWCFKDTDNCSFIGNHITSNYYGINCSSQADSNHFANNYFFGVTQVLDDGGTNNKIDDNRGYNPVGYIANYIEGNYFVDSGSGTLANNTVYTCTQSAKNFYIYGGTVGSVQVNSVTVAISTGINIHVECEDTLKVVWSVEPTIRVIGE